jgi:hypothetical protein
MARENQGLQITLIGFVMLTIVLGVTTYVAFKNYSEAWKAKEAAEHTATEKELLARSNGDDANKLKEFIGAATTDKVTDIGDGFKKEMETYAGNLAKNDQNYRRLVAKMYETNKERNEELTDVKAKFPEFKKEYERLLEEKETHRKQFELARDKAVEDLNSEKAKYDKERDRKNEEGAKLDADLKALRKDLKDQSDKFKGDLLAANGRIKQLSELVSNQGSIIEGYRHESLGVANGRITWVNQSNGTVWINVGLADALPRQVTFSVYPGDATDMTATNSATLKKGSIEVTHVLGDHWAEARIVDDVLSNPIIPGDKIFTPLWSTGEQKHFALAGVMDVNGDGKSDLQTVMNLIALNHGVVDCYIADSGPKKDQQVGEITVKTNCLIVGTKPTEKEYTGQLATFSKMNSAADDLRLQKIQLGDLLQRMGWKNLSSVVRYGLGVNPDDFIERVPPGMQRKSTGSVSEVYDKRQPPTPGGADDKSQPAKSPSTTGPANRAMYYKF